MNRFGGTLLGAVMIVLGVLIILKRSYYSSLYYAVIDYGEYHVLIGCVVVLFGARMMHVSLKRPPEPPGQPSR